jgi:phospholipid/cholesterol/gamma-HCH transport system ATP-binding protein
MSEADTTVLRLEDVTVRFEETTALDRVNLTLAAGDTCIVLGAAGSGKTVMLKTALGLIMPDHGRVILFGHDISRLDADELRALRSHMGILFQEGGLFDSLTIEENVAYPLENQKADRPPPAEIAARVREALRFVELEHTLDKVPSELSGGMRRRVGIARAVVTQPRLVLYDSPTAGLDPITANTIMALIAKERDLRNTATLLATHRYQDGHLLANYRYNAKIERLEPVNGDGSAAAARTRFVVLGEGRVAFEGSQRELESTKDSYVAKFARFDRMR